MDKCKHGVRQTGLVLNDCPKCLFPVFSEPKPECDQLAGTVCDHIVGLRNIYHITNGIQPGFIEVHDSDIAGKYMMNYLFKDCPECGEKLNLKKDL